MFRSMFSDFDRDPFFNFDRSMKDAFGGLEDNFDFSTQRHLALNNNGVNDVSHERNQIIGKSRHRNGSQHRGGDLMPFGSGAFGGGHIFAQMDSLMSQMGDLQMRAQNDPNCQVYQSSHFYSYNSSDGASKPRVYQAHRSLRAAGGLREEQKAVRDSATGEEKMHLGRYIGDKGEVQERRRNVRTGDEEENREYYGLENEEETRKFDENWKSRVSGFHGAQGFTSHNRLRNDEAKPATTRRNHIGKALPSTHNKLTTSSSDKKKSRSRQ